MKEFENDKNSNKERNEIKTFSVPIPLEKIKDNIFISTTINNKYSEEEIIDKAFKFHKEGNITEAAEHYKLFIDKGFIDSRVFLNYGIILKAFGNLKDAEKYTRRAINIQPNFAQAYDRLGIILKDLGDLEGAEIYLRKAIELQPDFADSYNNLGLVLKDSGNLEEAEKIINKAIKLKPNFSIAYYNLANIQTDFSKLEQAEVSMRKAIEFNPNSAEAYNNIGFILKELNKLEEAEISTLKAIDIRPDFADAFNNLGIIQKDLGNLPAAEISTRKAISLKPRCVEFFNNLGLILIQLGKIEEAQTFINKAIELNPMSANSYNNLASIFLELNKLEEAELSALKAIDIRPNFAEAYNNLGSIMKDLGNLEKAEAFYSKAIYLKSGFTDALRNRWLLLFNKKEFTKALKDADLCNTSESRVLALETLFALKEIDEIYARIEKMSETEDQNIYLAAFSSFIAHKEKKDTSNEFCKNPLSFLYFSNLKSHRTDYVKFINQIITELYDIKTIWQPKNRTTRNGFQTPTYLNLFSNSKQNISQLKLIILNEINEYYLKYKSESCSFIKKWPSIKNIIGWNVILKKQGYQSAHIHPSGWLSGVIYLKVVPSLEKDEGAIEFSLNGVGYSDDNSPHLTYQPSLGDIVLFPSSLHHRTIPFTTNTDRIVISFDLIP